MPDLKPDTPPDLSKFFGGVPGTGMYLLRNVDLVPVSVAADAFIVSIMKIITTINRTTMRTTTTQNAGFFTISPRSVMIVVIVSVAPPPPSHAIPPLLPNDAIFICVRPKLILLPRKSPGMEFELSPFPEVSFRAGKVGKLWILNLASRLINAANYAVHTIHFGERRHESGCARYHVARQTWESTGTKELLRLCALETPLEVDAIYVVSPTPVLDFLIAAHTAFRKAKRKKRAEPDPIVVDAAFGDVFRMQTALQQHGSPDASYAIAVQLSLAFADPKAVKYPYLSAAFYQSLISPIQGRMESMNSDGALIAISFVAASEDSLVHDVEEMIVPEKHAMIMNHQTIQDLIHFIYLSPAVAARMFFDGCKMPTKEFLETEHEAIEIGAQHYLTHFNDLLIECDCHVTLPPMPSEDAFRLISRLELTIAPKIADQVFVIERIGNDDPLFEKLYQRVEATDGSDLLSFTYGSLLDAGQIFTYNECAELSARLQKI